MIATYRACKHIASFEFFGWLVMVQADGATEIVVDTANPKTTKFSVEKVLQRYESIVLPGAALAGLPCRRGTDPTAVDAVASQLRPWCESGRTFKRLISPREPIRNDFTVTIRDNETAKERDSNPDVWYKFAEEIGATIIEDYRVKPIDLHERVALYAGAKMNFGVCNGPMYLCSLTPYPTAIVVNNHKAARLVTKWGTPHGGNFPWMLSNQANVWIEDSSLDNLRRAFDQMSASWA